MNFHIFIPYQHLFQGKTDFRRKQTIFIKLFITIVLLTGCDKKNNHSHGSSNLIEFNIKETYSKKKILLQDIADISYIPLETTNDYLWENRTNLGSISKDFIICYSDKNILIFDGSGKVQRKINRYGNSGEEYISISTLLTDESEQELFIYDMNKNQILVYDFQGTFKRSFTCSPDIYYQQIGLFGTDMLICYILEEIEENIFTYFILISKQTGETIKKITIPYKKWIDHSITTRIKDGTRAISKAYIPLVPSDNNWLLTELSADTVYLLTPDTLLTPVFTKNPSVQSMQIPVFVHAAKKTQRYFFFHTVKKEYDFEKGIGLPETSYLYDDYKKQFYLQDIYDTNYVAEKKIDIQPVLTQYNTDNNAMIKVLQADDLIELYHEEKLKGKLKNVAALLQEEDNPVLMVIRFK